MHGGAIWAENRASGGAAFMFTVPVRQKTGHADKTSHATIH
jgi:signal transduction histidine kinase